LYEYSYGDAIADDGPHFATELKTEKKTRCF